MRVLVGMLSAAFLVAAASTAGPLAAQTVRGQLVDSVSRTPLGGAFLTLVDQGGAERARTLTDQNGQFILNAPSPGTYHLRSKRIGFRPYVSAALALRAGEVTTVAAAVDPIPIPLREVVVAGDRQCDVEAGASVAALWEEVKEALAVVAWTSRVPGYWYELTMFERDLNAGGRRNGVDSVWRHVGYQQVSFRSAPADVLASTGYVVVNEADWVYYAPDADVLLSDPFLRTHCFETKVGRGETDRLVGLAFSPARDRTLPDVTGTLWVDRETSELRHLEFTYTRLPERVVAPRAGGRVDFMRVPTGAWIVRDWVIRMPVAQIVRTALAQDQWPQVVGFRETGGSAVEIKTRAGAVVYRAQPVEAVAVAAAPPPPPPPAQDTVRERPRRPGRRVHEVLLEEEFRSSTAVDALGVVQQYRPNWLRYRGPISIRDPNAGRVQVYVDGVHWGDANRLRDIPAGDILEMRFLSGPEATTRYGMGHGGGAIEVQTR